MRAECRFCGGAGARILIKFLARVAHAWPAPETAIVAEKKRKEMVMFQPATLKTTSRAAVGSFANIFGDFAFGQIVFVQSDYSFSSSPSQFIPVRGILYLSSW